MIRFREYYGFLHAAIDQINRRWGRDSVKSAAAGLVTGGAAWKGRQARKSPTYTTSWLELPVAKAR